MLTLVALALSPLLVAADGPVFPLPALQPVPGLTTNYSVLAADLDLDGHEDLAVGMIDSTLRVLHGDGTGHFALAQSLTMSSQAASLRSCDLDHDGHPDLVAADSGGYIEAFLGASTGFGPGLPLTMGVANTRPVLMTADMDGLPGDEIVASVNKTLVVVGLGAGPALIQKQALTVAPTNLTGAALVDVDSDGDLDVVACAGGITLAYEVSIASNVGGVLSASPDGLHLTMQSSALAAADLDADGHADLVIGGFDGKLRIARGTGAGGFLPVSATLDNGVQPHFIAVAQLGADAFPDILAAGSTPQAVRIHRGLAGGAFQPMVLTPIPPWSLGLAIADLDEDGREELIAAGKLSLALTITPIQDSGLPVEHPHFATGGDTVDLKLGDLDGDGDLDVVTANRFDGSLSVLAGDGTGALLAVSSLPLGSLSEPNSVALADLDADGNLDLVAPRYQKANVSVWLGQGDLNFTSAPDVAVGLYPLVVLATQLDADGLPDLATLDVGTATVSVRHGTGTGTFVPGPTLPAGMSAVALVAGDLDGDGWTDLLTGNQHPSPVSAFTNDHVGGFTGPVTSAVATDHIPLALDDLDGDGKDDLIGGHDFFGVSVYFSTGGQDSIPMVIQAAAFAMADLDGDGRRDLAACEAWANTLSVVSNTGAGYGPPRFYTAGLFPVALAAGDLDSDGKPELVVAEGDAARVSVLKNLSPAFAWTDLGHGLDGLHGPPRLVGTGVLAAGQPELLKLDRARGSSLALLFTSLIVTPTKFKGGKVLTAPFALPPVALMTAPNGTLTLPFLWPAGLPSGFQFFLQAAVADPDAVHGASISNAIRVRQP